MNLDENNAQGTNKMEDQDAAQVGQEIESQLGEDIEEVIEAEDVLNVDEDGNLEAFSMEDLDMDDLDDFDDVIEEDTAVIEASEDLSLASGNYIWYIGEPIPVTFRWITKQMNGKPVPVKLYSAGLMIRVVYDIANQCEINEGFIQNFYFYSKDGKPNRMGLAQAKQFATHVLSAYEGNTREEIQQMLIDQKVGNFRLFKELLPCAEDDKKYVTSKIRRKDGKGDYKGVFSNDIPTTKIKDATALYESVCS